jgi:hypothetical protein
MLPETNPRSSVASYNNSSMGSAATAARRNTQQLPQKQQQQQQEQQFTYTTRDSSGRRRSSGSCDDSDETTARRTRALEPFDPFSDLLLTPIDSHVDDVDSGKTKKQSHHHHSYSSYHCVGTGTRDPAWQRDDASRSNRGNDKNKNDVPALHRPNFVSRSCRYRNLYYRVSDQSFHYYASPTESHALAAAVSNNSKKNGTTSPSTLQLDTRMEVSLGHVDDLLPFRRLDRVGVTAWKPVLHTATPPPSTKNVGAAAANSSSSSHPSDGAPSSSDPSASTATTNAMVLQVPRNAHFLLYQPFHSMNIGHFIWDDLLSLFSLLDLFDLVDGTYSDDDNVPLVQPVPFFVELADRENKINFGGPDPLWRCSPANHVKWNQCVKVYRKHYAALFGTLADRCSGDLLRTGNWLRGRGAIGAWKDSATSAKASNCTRADPVAQRQQQQPNRFPSSSSSTVSSSSSSPSSEDYVLLPNVLAGTGRLGFFGCEGDCSLGRGPQFWRFRNFLLKKLNLCPGTTPVGYITISLPVGSSRPDQVHAFTAEIDEARRRYGDGVVRVVDMAQLTWREQADLVQNTAVLLTNHGGGGVVSIFLPRGAAVFNFWHGDRQYVNLRFLLCCSSWLVLFPPLLSHMQANATPWCINMSFLSVSLFYFLCARSPTPCQI